MSTLADACGDAAQRELRRFQLQVLESPDVRPAAQRALEGEIRSCPGETVDLRQYRAPALPQQNCYRLE